MKGYDQGASRTLAILLQAYCVCGIPGYDHQTIDKIFFNSTFKHQQPHHHHHPSASLSCFSASAAPLMKSACSKASVLGNS